MNRRNAPNLVVTEQLRDPEKIDSSNSTFVLAVSSQLTKRRIAFEQWLDHEDRSAFDVFSSIETFRDVLTAERTALETHDYALQEKIESMSVGQTSLGQMHAELSRQFSADVVQDDVRDSVSSLQDAIENNEAVINQMNGQRKNAGLLLSLLRQHGSWIDRKLEEKALKFNHDPNVELIEVDTAPLPFPTLEDDFAREPLVLKTSEPLPPMYPPMRAPQAAATTPASPAIKTAKAVTAEVAAKKATAFEAVNRDLLIEQSLRALKLKTRPSDEISALSESVYVEPIKQTAKLINERLSAGQSDEDTLLLIDHRRRLMALAKEANDKVESETAFSAAALKSKMTDIEIEAAMSNNDQLVKKVIPSINQLRAEILAELERRQESKEETKHLLETHWNLRSLANQLKDYIAQTTPGALNLSYVVEKKAEHPDVATAAPVIERNENLSTADAIELMTGEPLDQDERDELTPYTLRWTEEIVKSAQHLTGTRTDTGMLEAIYKISLIEPRDDIRKEIVRQRREGLPLESYRHLLEADKELTSCVKKADGRLQERLSPANVTSQAPAENNTENNKAGWLSRASKWASGLLDRARSAVGQLVENLTPRPQIAMATAATLATAVALGSITTGFNAKSGAIADTVKAPEAKVALVKIDPAAEAFSKTSLSVAKADTAVMHGDYTLAEAKQIIAQSPAPTFTKSATPPATKKVFEEKAQKADANIDAETTSATKEQSYKSACSFAYGTEGEDRVNQCLNLAMK